MCFEQILEGDRELNNGNIFGKRVTEVREQPGQGQKVRTCQAYWQNRKACVLGMR